jgi:dermatan 4-sulfotransferase 1
VILNKCSVRRTAARDLQRCARQKMTETQPPTADWIDDASSKGILNMEDTWVSSKFQYFYMGVPKTACSKVKMLLQQLEGNPLPVNPFGVHERTAPGIPFVSKLSDFASDVALKILSDPNWFRFAFVRNPYSRLLSGYKNKVMDLKSPWKGFRESIREQAGYPTPPGETPGMVAFRDFVRYVRQQPDEVRDGHWRSQFGTMCADRISYDFVGRMETFVKDVSRVLERFGASRQLRDLASEIVGASAAVPMAVAYDTELANIVYEMYRLDFETFGYERDSWRKPD